jgi:hypothetical protein
MKCYKCKNARKVSTEHNTVLLEDCEIDISEIVKRLRYCSRFDRRIVTDTDIPLLCKQI